MECQQCKAEMKKMAATTGWVQKGFYWCPECGTFLNAMKPLIGKLKKVWYKPGYLFEQEVI